ncbi:2-dehydropantoate 2-reductase [Fusarium albosuccineum]|uniref:2-dehydropantoate 2-reductase n=1 Tax=Fusarium albosuccineum TaxID=1237068 RepID=A0A8H4P1I6_9HYPO|nr:2-dehydropantoate 2-reductase [Fusarium albosuccineum]
MATRNVSGSQVRQSMATSGNAVKSRQLGQKFNDYSDDMLDLNTDESTKQAQLNSQLAQLSANLSDTENLLRMTSVQAEAMRGLGSWHGGLFMAASKVLGEESVKEAGQPGKFYYDGRFGIMITITRSIEVSNRLSYNPGVFVNRISPHRVEGFDPYAARLYPKLQSGQVAAAHFKGGVDEVFQCPIQQAGSTDFVYQVGNCPFSNGLFSAHGSETAPDVGS